MTTKALVTKSELLRMAKIAKQYGVIVEQEYNGVIVRVAPLDAGSVKPAKTGPRWAPAEDAPPPPIQPPLNRYEEAVMKTLTAIGPNAKLRYTQLRSFGPATEEKLLARGYIDVIRPVGGRLKDEVVCLTEKGFADWQKQRDHISSHPHL
ncbi:hypothetical protein K7A42_21435 [Agrobacterium sp. InxBP2]|uniref:hypothetical protein n=1 Tax=Agrobacterium sp. InxBP2 TaxID=2870329 RepID=UPI00249F2D00|nr:hypothetical protein [Agrobacterium sp. InxBP2]MCW8283465.1 hypothetical protein [Agrobacterium sp. InxBP2]